MSALTKLLRALKGNWPAALVIVAGLVAFVLTILFAPPDVREWLLGAEGFVGTVIGIYLRSPADRASTPPEPPSGG